MLGECPNVVALTNGIADSPAIRWRYAIHPTPLDVVMIHGAEVWRGHNCPGGSIPLSAQRQNTVFGVRDMETDGPALRCGRAADGVEEVELVAGVRRSDA